MRNPKGGFAPAYEEFYNNYNKPEVEDNRSLQSSASYTRHKAPKLHEVVEALDAGYRVDEIYEKIWQMFLHENYLRDRARKTNFVRRLNGGGLESNDCADKCDKGKVGSTTSFGDEDVNEIAETSVRMCIVCDADGEALVLDNVADMTYEQLLDTVSTNLSLRRKKLRIISLTRIPSYHKITDIHFDDYKHNPATQMEGHDWARLETTTIRELNSAGNVAIGDTTGLADLAAALKLGIDEMELDVGKQEPDEVGTVDGVQIWVRRDSGWRANVDEV